jgi:hypothetical protein
MKGLERKTPWGAGRRGGLELLAGRVRFRSNTVRRAFAVLDPTSSKMLSKDLGVSLSTYYCSIIILFGEGYVEKIAHRQGYGLWPAGGASRPRAHSRDVEGRVESLVEDLALRFNRHACFGSLSDGDVTVARIESPRREFPRRGPRLLHGLARAHHGQAFIPTTGPAGAEDSRGYPGPPEGRDVEWSSRGVGCE